MVAHEEIIVHRVQEICVDNAIVSVPWLKVVTSELQDELHFLFFLHSATCTGYLDCQLWSTLHTTVRWQKLIHPT